MPALAPVTTATGRPPGGCSEAVECRSEELI
jgi:hypothetical protein